MTVGQGSAAAAAPAATEGAEPAPSSANSGPNTAAGAGVGTLAVTGDEAADRLVNTNPLALLTAMLLDQQITMEWAFMGPHRLQERLGVELAPGAVAARPALHRFPGAMAERTMRLCHHLIDHYNGDAAAVWTGAATGAELLDRIRDLPGYGDEKAKILVAVLGKRFGIRPDGWEAACAPFSNDQPRTVADIDSPKALNRVRAWKKAQKAKAEPKTSEPGAPAALPPPLRCWRNLKRGA